MSDITFPLSAENVAQVVAERDAEIERLRRVIKILYDSPLNTDGREEARCALGEKI